MTTYRSPQSMKVYSKNGQYYVYVDVDSNCQKVFAVSDEKTPLFSFSFDAKDFYDFFLSNNGRHVVISRWKHVRKDEISSPCLWFIGENGVVKTYMLKELCRLLPWRNPLEVGPIGYKWRIWKKWEEITDDTYLVRIPRRKTLKFSLQDGRLIEKSFWATKPK